MGRAVGDASVPDIYRSKAGWQRKPRSLPILLAADDEAGRLLGNLWIFGQFRWRLAM
jgi:hypothetical protein